MDQKYIIALEFSSSQVKGALASAPAMPSSPMDIPVIEAVAHEDKTTCAQYGRVQNLIDAAKDASFIIQKLENCQKIRPGKINGAYVGLAGRSMSSMRASTEITFAAEQEITPDILKRLIGDATKMVPGDKMAAAVLPTRFIVNNQATKNPVGLLGSKIKGEFTIVTCSPVNRRNIEIVLNERMGIPVMQFVVTPLAVADMVLGDEEKQLGCILVDLGAQTSTVSIYKDRALQYLATIPMGSANITQDIATGMSHVKERAELVKINQANALPEPVNSDTEANRLNCYVQARLGEIIANIAAQIEFAGFKAADLCSGFILTGRGAKLKNMAKAFESQTKLKARYASIPATVKVADPTIEPIDYTSIIAIAMAGAADDDPVGCVEMPTPVAKPEPEPEMTYVDFGVDEDDIDLLVDSVDEEKNKLKAAQKKLEEERRIANKRQEEIRKEKERKEKEKEKERKENEKERGSRVPLGTWLKSFFFADDDVNQDEEVNLDE